MEIAFVAAHVAAICFSCRKQAGANTGEASTLKALHSRLAPILVTDKNTIIANNEHYFAMATKMLYCQVCGTLVMIYVTYKRKTKQNFPRVMLVWRNCMWPLMSTTFFRRGAKERRVMLSYSSDAIVQTTLA